MENSAKYNEALYETAKRTLRLSLIAFPYQCQKFHIDHQQV